MKLLIVFPIAVLLLAAADTPPGSPDQSAKPGVSASAAPLPAGVPAGSVQIAPFSYRYTRADGKTWLYHKTPFGIMSAEEKPAPRALEDRAMALVKATAAGDMIRFEWTTPVGLLHWQKKESELSEMEKAVWDRDRSPNPSAQD